MARMCNTRNARHRLSRCSLGAFVLAISVLAPSPAEEGGTSTKESPMMKLMVVSEIVETPNGVAIEFDQGASGEIDRRDFSASTYELYKELVDYSSDGWPVGVAIDDEGCIRQMTFGDADFPRDVRFVRGQGLRVGFLGHPAPYYVVEVNHPRFAEVRDTLECAADRQLRVWFAADASTDPQTLHDVAWFHAEAPEMIEDPAADE
jgi:hypothetical protein